MASPEETLNEVRASEHGDRVMDGEPRKSLADDVLDELMPEGLDWRDKVVAYPLTALVLSGLGGFVLGRRHGSAILEALSNFAATEVDRNISSILGADRSERPDG